MRISGDSPSDTPMARFSFLRAATAWSEVIGPPVRDAMKAKAPVGFGHGAGALRQSIRYERSVITSGVEVRFIAGVPYAGYVISGTGPHVIRAVQARALHFMWGGRTPGAYAFAAWVNHPGTKANPFPKEVLEVMAPFITKTLRYLMSGE
jgi:hypothetical protein